MTVYPVSRRIDVVDQHFGRRIVDSYRWLENDAREDPHVAAWVAAQNAVTEQHIAALPGRDAFRRRLNAILDYEQIFAPIKRCGRYFFTRSSGRENQAVLLARISGEDRVLADPNGWSDDAADALAEWAPSDDGRLVAIGVQAGGADWRTIKVVDVDTGATLGDEVRWARFTEIVWAKDGSGFFYSRYPEPKAGLVDMASLTHHAIYFHVLDTPQTADRLVHHDPARPEFVHVASRTEDGRYLIVTSTAAAGVNALSVVDLSQPDWTPRAIIPLPEAEWTVLGNDGEVLTLLTSDAADRRRIVTLDLGAPLPTPVEIVPEDAAVLTTAAIVGGRILATYLVDAKTEIRRFGRDGTPEGTVELPGIGSAGGFRGNAADREAFLLFTSFDTPLTVYRYDVDTGELEVWIPSKRQRAEKGILVQQRFFASKDGVRIPIFIVRRGDVTGPSPTLLHGYGGFGISMIPVYNPAQMAWVEAGGVLAIANIRGGGEYGRSWHDAGRLEKRQNAFDDFIAAGEFLKSEKITSEGGLAIQGESNGGLLVGAVTNQRPDLFAAALPGVGVMDMLRFHRFTGGMMWVSDFGSPEQETSFETLHGYSPYHNIRPGTGYPAILATTADADDRVAPGHTFKYVAALQSADLGPRPRLVRVETRAGHGAGMPRHKIVALYADMWTFAAYWTGLTMD